MGKNLAMLHYLLLKTGDLKKTRQLIRSDQLLSQLPRGNSDGHWLRPMFLWLFYTYLSGYHYI